MLKTFRGIILRETKYKDADKILSVLTAENGRVTITARNARRKNNKLSAGTQLVSFSEFTIEEYNGRYYLKECTPIELFDGIRLDIEKLSLAAYFSELISSVSAEESDESELMALLLMTYNQLSVGKLPENLIKASFELRLICISGYAPQLDYCSCCGKQYVSTERFAFSMQEGGIICCECRKNYGGEQLYILNDGIIMAMKYISDCPIERIFSFALDADSCSFLSALTEKYCAVMLDKNFKTLDFWKNICFASQDSDITS